MQRVSQRSQGYEDYDYGVSRGALGGRCLSRWCVGVIRDAEGLTCIVAGRPRGYFVYVWGNNVACGRVLSYVSEPLAYYRCHIYIGRTVASIDVFVRRLLKDPKTTCTKRLCVASSYHNSHRGKQAGYMFPHCSSSASEVMAEGVDCVEA